MSAQAVRDLKISEVENERSDAGLTGFEQGRFFSMINNSPLNIFTANLDGVIDLVNPMAYKTLKRIEHLLPVSIDKVQGSNYDIFHKNPAYVRKILSNPRNLPHRAKIRLGDEILDLLISALYDSNGIFLGPMVTWDIITHKVRISEALEKTAEELGVAVTSLLEISSQMIENTERTDAQSVTVSTSAQEVSSGVTTVVTSMEEMTASIRQITQSTNQSSSMSNEALEKAKNANAIISQLDVSSQDIGNVTKVISSIAQQTNLLALNATIEAARAGEAGKGFAVVANEVKDLAKETAKATADITKKIEAIQTDTGEAISAIGEITESIESLNSVSTNIAAAVEEQAATTNDVTRVVGESARSLAKISENTDLVVQASRETSIGASKTDEAARQLNMLAEKIRELAKQVQI